MEENRCKNCIWYEDCKNNNDLAEFCEYLDPVEEEETHWMEMSYNRFKKKGDD